MKQILTSLVIAKNKHIEIYFPDIKNKFNYYYEPTEKLHKFDEVTITYCYNDKKVLLYKDILDDAFRISIRLQEAKQGHLELPSKLEVGQMIYALNESDKDDGEKIYKEIDFSNYWVWSVADQVNGAETFMYTYQGSLYLEIGKVYEWHHEDEDIDLMLYKEFIKNYKPILVEKISPETAQQWLQQCNEFIKQIE